VRVEVNAAIPDDAVKSIFVKADNLGCSALFGYY